MIKYGHESRHFFVKNQKKDHPIDFLAHKVVKFWQHWRFLTKYGHGSRGLPSKIKKNDLWASYFWGKGRFLTKYRHKSIVFFRERTFSVKNGHGSNNLSIKNRKKDYAFDFFGSYYNVVTIIYCSFDRIDDFWPNMGMTAGELSFKFWKKRHESTFIMQMTFLDKIWT